MRILLAEDDEVIADALSRALARSACAVRATPWVSPY
jgi:DNA-binding response OmpR family regulator